MYYKGATEYKEFRGLEVSYELFDGFNQNVADTIKEAIYIYK